MRKHRGNRNHRPWMVPSWVVILIRWGMGEHLRSFFRGILSFFRSCFGRQRQRRRSSSSSLSMQNVIHNQPSGCGIGCISNQGCCNRTKVRGGGDDDDDNDNDNACCCCCCNCHDRRSVICSCPWKTNQTTGSKSFSTSSSEVYPMEGDWIIHERQALQLCAVHTINNLLQLVSEQQEQVLQKEENKPLTWICGPIVIEPNTMTTSTKLTSANTTTFDTQISPPSSSSLLCSSKLSKNDSYPTTSIQIPWKSLPKVASQEELDDIATELMMIENSLLDDYSSVWTDDAVGSNSCLSRIRYSISMFRHRWLGCCHRWHNTHSTMYYGNYSMETLEVALQRRHIQLEWFAPTIISNHHDDAFNPSYLWEVPSGIVVGFIVNQLLDGEWDVADDKFVNHGHDETTNPETTIRNKDSAGNGLDIAGYEGGEIYSSRNLSSRKEAMNPCQCISRLSSWLFSQLTRIFFHRIFGCDDPGRHWYAITRVRRTFHDESPSDKANKIHDHPPSNHDRWKIIDSDRTDQAYRLRPNQLHSHLYRLSQQHNATIFRAILTFPEDPVGKDDIP